MSWRADTAELVWHGDYPADVIEKVRQSLMEDLDGLSKASDLCFHTVFLSDDIDDGPVVIVWGENRDRRLHCEYHGQSELVPLRDIDERSV